MQKTGVFGSAFNPPTQGHRDVLIQAAPHFDNILLVPSVAHAFHKKTLPLAKRVELLEAFCVDISTVFCKFEISLIESELLKTGEALASISLAKQSSRTPLPKQVRTQLQEWLTPAVMALILEQKLYYSP